MKYGAQYTVYSSGGESIITIEERGIKEYIIIIGTLFSIFYLSPRLSPKDEREHKKEYDYSIILGLIGITFLLFSKELILIYLGIELYNFSTYILLLAKETIKIRKLSIIYLILSSLSSAFFLIFILILYMNTGSFNIDTISLINIYSPEQNKLLLLLFFLTFLFKIGSFPFIHWILSLYNNLERKILFYQLIIPKFFYYFIFISICKNCIVIEDSLFIFLFIFSTISILISSFSGLNPLINKSSLLLTYSSVLNIGLLLLLFSFFSLNFHTLHYFIIFNFFLIYIVNSLGLFSFLSLPYYSSSSFLSYSFSLTPFLFLSLLFLIFSFIGIPPFSGFFAKFYLLIYLTNYIDSYLFFSLLSIIVLILSTILSSLLYFKFFTPKVAFDSSLPSPTLPLSSESLRLLLSFCSLFSIFYTYYIPFLLPLFLS